MNSTIARDIECGNYMWTSNDISDPTSLGYNWELDIESGEYSFGTELIWYGEAF